MTAHLFPVRVVSTKPWTRRRSCGPCGRLVVQLLGDRGMLRSGTRSRSGSACTTTPPAVSGRSVGSGVCRLSGGGLPPSHTSTSTAAESGVKQRTPPPPSAVLPAARPPAQHLSLPPDQPQPRGYATGLAIDSHGAQGECRCTAGVWYHLSRGTGVAAGTRGLGVRTCPGGGGGGGGSQLRPSTAVFGSGAGLCADRAQCMRVFGVGRCAGAVERAEDSD